MPTLTCYVLAPIDQVRVYLRRYRSVPRDGQKCPLSHGYHNAKTLLFDEPALFESTGSLRNGTFALLPQDDPRWPLSCACGYVFTEEDRWQRFVERLYRRADTGELMTSSEAPDGAMWEAPWMDQFHLPQGKHNLIVKLPGGYLWEVDGPANNCTKPHDRGHHCWIRHGEAPLITVDKAGNTCDAGAGSIAYDGFHGFLRNGVIEY